MTKKIDYNKWHSGPPPSVGWWPASWLRSEGLYRWWDGKCWSHSATQDATAIGAAREASKKTGFNEWEIQWQHRPASWPARSRT